MTAVPPSVQELGETVRDAWEYEPDDQIRQAAEAALDRLLEIAGERDECDMCAQYLDEAGAAEARAVAAEKERDEALRGAITPGTAAKELCRANIELHAINAQVVARAVEDAKELADALEACRGFALALTAQRDKARAQVAALTKALAEYADPRNWGISRDDLNYRVCSWLGDGAMDTVPDGPRIARSALAGSPANTDNNE